MSEEEKKAIELLIEYDIFGDEIATETIKTILNLIEKQQEEIKRLKTIITSFENGEMKIGEKYE